MAFDDSKAIPNREDLLRRAIDSARNGNNDAARLMFEQILSEDKNNERAMMWLAKLADTKAERKQWLNRVLSINPNNDAAREALRKISYRRAARENRTLIIFGTIVVVLVVLALAIAAILLTTQ
jgi:Tfp pilus assembly protein PilF